MTRAICPASVHTSTGEIETMAENFPTFNIDPSYQPPDKLRIALEEIRKMADSSTDNPRMTLTRIRALARAALK